MQNNAYEQKYMCPDQIRTQGTKRIRAMMREKCTEGEGGKTAANMRQK